MICEPVDVGAMGATLGGPLEVKRVASVGERGILVVARGVLIMKEAVSDFVWFIACSWQGAWPDSMLPS